MTIQSAKILKLEEDLNQDNEQKQIPFGYIYRQSSFQRSDSLFESLHQDQMYNSHGQDLDQMPSKYQKKGSSKVLQLMNQGVIKQFNEQPPQTFVDKAEIIKKIRTILAKDCKERGESDLDFLQDCYGERIDFFKVISGRYGLTALKNVFKVMKYETFQKGDKIFQIGDKGDKFYIILLGKVKVTIPKKQIQDIQANLQALSRMSNFMNIPQISPKRQSIIGSPKSLTKKNSSLISMSQMSVSFQKILNQNSSYRGKKSSQIFLKMSEFQQNSMAIQKRRLSKLLLEPRNSIQNTIQENYDPKDYLEELSSKYNIVRELGKGESFGEMSMQIKQNNQRNTTVFADEKCELAVISRNDYMEIITPLQQGDAEEKLDFLQNIPYFQNWDKKDLRTLSYSLEIQEVPKGSFLYKEDDNSNDLYMILKGEFKVTKQCSSKISEVQDVEHSKLVTMKENLLICVCHQFEILGEESVLSLKKRDFSIQASTLDSQVYRISHYDLENVYKNLTNNREDNYFNLLESLIQKREWKLDRFSELFYKFLKERKLMHLNTINYARLNSIHSSSSSSKKMTLSQGASPNNLKLKATQNQYSAKLNFTNAFQSLGEYTNQSEQDQVQETLKFRSLSQSLVRKSSSRQQSQRQIKASHRSQTSSSSEDEDDQKSINQFTIKTNDEQEVNNGSNRFINNQEQNQNQNSSIIQKLFDSDSYYKKLQLKLKKANDIKQTKYKPQKLDHNKILNLDYTPQSSRKENQNQDQNKSPKVKQFNKHALSPFNNGFKQDLQNNKQLYQLKLNQQNPNFKPQAGKMKLSQEDEKALEDYYKLTILPISVVFSKADESNQKKISSSNDQMLQRLKLLGIETPKRSQLNKTQDQSSPKKAFKIRKSESTGQLHNQNLNSPSHSKESDRQNYRQNYMLKSSQFQQKQNQRASLDQNTVIQIIREKNGSISQQKINQKYTPKNNNSNLSINNQQYNQNENIISKTQQSFNENTKLQGEVGNLLKKEKQEQEQYEKEKQFIDTMKSYANVYKLVEMNYLESHSIKAHQLMKETMDDMNLIRKFAQQSNKKNSIVTNFAKEEFKNQLLKKQKQEKFEKLKKRGIINENEVNMDDSIELNQHLKKIADLQQQIYDNINDPTGSRSNNYNFGGLKKRKVGVQLSDQLNFLQQMPAFQQSQPHTKKSITEESLSNISQIQVENNNFSQKNLSSNVIDNQKKDENFQKNENHQNFQQQQIQKKTMGVLAMMQKQYKQSIDQPIQKNLEIFNLKNKFQKSAQLRLFKQLKQEEQSTNNKGLSIFNTANQIKNKNQIKDKINKFEPQKSMEAFVQRGFQRQSNTQYLSNLFFGQIYHSKDHKESNDTHPKLPKNIQFSNQSVSSINQSQTNPLKPYQHINNIKPSEFSQFNSVWDNGKKQLQFQRILNYKR
ncbi:hypothetical protein ABPG72_013487 [Tetrahymena utriculariae]